jgi:glycosyltransferase involved in cell wall biosynthesis
MTIVDVTVCTPSLAHRNEMLVECMASVRNQTWQPRAHLVGVDYDRAGASVVLNRLISAADTEWIAPLADDDLLYPHYIESLLSNAEDADMIYPWCEVTGTRNGWNPNSLLDIKRLKSDNYIPATVLIRKSAWEKVGGYPEVVCEDHAMWIKLIEADLKIKCLPEILWQYRFHGRNISDGQYEPWEV